MTTQWHLPKPTREFVGPLTMTVTINGTPTPWTDFQIAVTPYGVQPPAPEEDPTMWETPAALDGDLGVMFGYDTTHGTTPGRYSIAAAPNGVAPEAPVVENIGVVIVQ